MSPFSECFTEHRKTHIARLPDLSRQKYDDEVQKIGLDGGLLECEMPPNSKIVTGYAPTSREGDHEASQTKYLWVVGIEGVPIALEHPRNGNAFQLGRLTHTNLTGAAEAHTAGELWFYDNNSVVINGGSSRYRPRSEEELISAATSFKNAGYRVFNMGWDESGPVRLLRGKLEWV